MNNDSFKIMVLGEAGVGKSSLIRRFTNGTFSARTITTVGVDRVPIKISVDNEELQFQVLDTAGSFGFRGLIKSYMTNIDAVVLMYDISNKETFACLPLWTTLLKNSGKQSLTKVLVGNKRDLSEDREVQFKNAKNYAEFEGMISIEVSVKQEESVDLVFQCIARELRLKKQLAAAQEAEKAHQQRRLSGGRSVDFIGDDFDVNGRSSSPRQFVRKLSKMISGKKGKSRQQQQQQELVLGKVDSIQGNCSTMRSVRSNSELFTRNKQQWSDRSYMLW